jgi:putative ABC transport system substrate-binding protein
MRLTRRSILSGMAASALATQTVHAQTGLPVVGILRNSGAGDGTFETQFRQELRSLGWQESRHVQFETRWADGDLRRLPQLAAELVAMRPRVLLGFGPIAIRMLQTTTPDIAIVGMSDDLVASHLAETMSRPGGNTTGVSIFAAELDAKRLELLREFLPQARRVGILYDPGVTHTLAHLDVAAQALGFSLVSIPAESTEAVGPALDDLIALQVDAINILASSILHGARFLMIERLRAARVPAIHQWPETAQDGGVLCYGPTLQGIYRQLAVFTDKILRGAAPAVLPIEHPTKLELAVNLRAAREIGIEFPATLLARADEVIE